LTTALLLGACAEKPSSVKGPRPRYPWDQTYRRRVDHRPQSCWPTKNETVPTIMGRGRPRIGLHSGFRFRTARHPILTGKGRQRQGPARLQPEVGICRRPTPGGSTRLWVGARKTSQGKRHRSPGTHRTGRSWTWHIHHPAGLSAGERKPGGYVWWGSLGGWIGENGTSGDASPNRLADLVHRPSHTAHGWTFPRWTGEELDTRENQTVFGGTSGGERSIAAFHGAVAWFGICW